MRVAVAMPWRGGDRHREDAFVHAKAMWEGLGLVVYTGDSGEPDFNRAASRNAAVARAGEFDVIVIADADCLVSRKAVAQAIGAAYLEDVVAFPHNHYVRKDHNGRTIANSVGPTNGGVLVMSDVAWGMSGGYDPRLKGWGLEDAAFWFATQVILGPAIHVQGDMVEMYHQRLHRMASRDPEEVALFERYRAAMRARDRDAMLALVASRG